MGDYVNINQCPPHNLEKPWMGPDCALGRGRTGWLRRAARPVRCPPGPWNGEMGAGNGTVQRETRRCSVPRRASSTGAGAVPAVPCGAPGLVPGRRQPLPGRTERAPGAAQSESHAPRGLTVLPGPGCPAAPETRILPGALPLTNPMVARPAPLCFSVFPSTLLWELPHTPVPGAFPCPLLWEGGRGSHPQPLMRDPGRSLVPRSFAALLLSRPGSENALFPLACLRPCGGCC